MLFFLVCHEFPAEESVLQFYRKKKKKALIKTILQFCDSIYFSACYLHDSANVQRYYRNFRARRNPLRGITSLRLAQRRNISLKDKQGILVPWTTPVFILQESSTPEWISLDIPRYLASTKYHWIWLLNFPWYNYEIGQLTFTGIPNCCKKRSLLQL